ATPGPSPRAWGSLVERLLPIRVFRSIPTCVGFTSSSRGPGSGTVHPHVRGVHTLATTALAATPGPSPRAWGSPRTGPAWRRDRRSIPTCVGFTRPGAALRLRRPVHPHVRGVHGPGTT